MLGINWDAWFQLLGNNNWGGGGERSFSKQIVVHFIWIKLRLTARYSLTVNYTSTPGGRFPAS